MITGKCHCGAVRLRAAFAPRSVGECNCSICSRLGVLWAYYDPVDVVIGGDTAAYAWGDRTMEFRRCHVCGCTTHWVSIDPEETRMAINARMLEGLDLGSVEVRKIDGASF
jgi:hypothetical protein